MVLVPQCFQFQRRSSANSSVYIWFRFLSISNFSVEAVLLSCLSIKTLILSTQFFCVNGCYAYFANHQRFKLLFYLIPPLCKLAIKKSFKSLRHESKLRMKCGIEETIWPRIAVISAYQFLDSFQNFKAENRFQVLAHNNCFKVPIVTRFITYFHIQIIL